MTVLGRPICQILGGHDWEKRRTELGGVEEIVSIDDEPRGPVITVAWRSDPYFECGRCGFVGESQWDDERLPAPVRMRGTDALVWWFLHGDEPSGWRWVPESERCGFSESQQSTQ